MADEKRYQVTDGPLSIRDSANGNRTGINLAQNEEITVTGEIVTNGGYLWVNHEKGWSALGKADGSEIYMQDISDRDPNAARRFEVVTDVLSIRSTPNGARLSEKLSEGTIFEVIPTSRTSAGGYIWWQHDKGWSAESDNAGKTIYLKEVFDTSETAQSGGETTTTTLTVTATTTTTKNDGSTATTTNGSATKAVDPANQKRYQVIDGPLSIRNSPNGNRTGGNIGQGAEITVTGDPVDEGGNLWVNHEKGWSALGTSDETEVYMLDISDRDPNAPRRFKVWSSVISVRETPNGKRTPVKLYRGTEVEALSSTRTESGGYIWWQHEQGWSAERNSAGNVTYLKEIFATPATMPIPEDQRTKIPDTWKGIYPLQIAQGVKVRGEPSTDPRGLVIKTLPRGGMIQCDMDTLTEADNYYWVRHDIGWSAIQSVNGKTVFLAEPGSIPGLIAIGADGPAAEDLPGYRALFTELPVHLDDIQWFQYFGNNMFAMRNAKNYGYDRYSQGMHGGLDFGNSLKPKPIYAGVEAEFVKVETSRANNWRVILKKDDYEIIYQHVTNPLHFNEGDIVTPETQLATIEHHSINNGWDHLHFEIRFMKNWIINPLLLFSEEIYNQIIGAFNPEKENSGYKKDFPKSLSNFFYHTTTWHKWVTPLDQPMINLGGPLIGPRAELDKSEI